MPTLGYTQLHSLSLITVVHFSPSTVTLYPSSIRRLLCLFPPSIFYDSTQCWFILSCLFFLQALCACIFFVIDGKCRVLFIRSNLFFFQSMTFESDRLVMHVQEKQTSESHCMLLRQWPCICSGRGLQNRRANFLAVGRKIKR